MGAADIVPGVSGGTVAFITGIYERLLYSLKSILPALFHFFKEREFKNFWLTINGTFLVTLFSGILLSVLSLAKLISYLLEHHPIPIWSTFFGLIVASVFVVAKEMSEWSVKLVFFALVGAISSWMITQLTPANVEPSGLNAFFSGILAICAMVLPGISGSFILVMLGTYSFILSAVKEFDFIILALFASGCLVGLLSIANILVWMFSHYKNITLAVLTGFMVGALSKVWPWKEVLQYREDSHGHMVALVEKNLLPINYEIVVGEPSQTLIAVFCAITSGLLVILLTQVAIKERS